MTQIDICGELSPSIVATTRVDCSCLALCTQISSCDELFAITAEEGTFSHEERCWEALVDDMIRDRTTHGMRNELPFLCMSVPHGRRNGGEVVFRAAKWMQGGLPALSPTENMFSLDTHLNGDTSVSRCVSIEVCIEGESAR